MHKVVNERVCVSSQGPARRKLQQLHMSEEKQFVLFFYVAWWQRGSGASWPKSSSTGAALTRATGHARNRGRMPRARAQPSANRVDRSLAAARGEARRGAARRGEASIGTELCVPTQEASSPWPRAGRVQCA